MYNPNMEYLLNNARNCLRIFLREADVKELWVPYELCSVVFKAARREAVLLKFYHIDDNFMPAQDFSPSDYILYPNYFGICDNIANFLATKYPNLIYDATQSFFAEPLGIATIYSARKFFPVTDGGILFTEMNLEMNFPKESEVENFSTDPFNFDYENFLKNELRFNRSDEIKLISDKSRLRLSKINEKEEKERRKENFAKLHKFFKGINQLNIPTETNAPMVYPLKTSLPVAEKLVEAGVFLIKYDYMKEIIPIPLEMAGKLPAITKLFANII